MLIDILAGDSQREQENQQDKHCIGAWAACCFGAHVDIGSMILRIFCAIAVLPCSTSAGRKNALPSRDGRAFFEN